MSGPSTSSLSTRQLTLATIAATAVITSSAILGGQALRRYLRTEKLKQSIGTEFEVDEDGTWDVQDVKAEAEASGSRLADESVAAGSVWRDKEWGPGEYDEDLIREQLSRNYSFFGDDAAMAKIRNAKVTVVGCGGVGSWCALMLARSGVGHIVLIDFDMTTLSSLNRHAAATLEDVGTPKVEATRKYLKKIAPWAKIETKVGLWQKGSTSEAWLDGSDWVVDAIDNITTKVDLLAHCHKSSLKVFSAMGAGAKCDPTKVQISDISMTESDPLAKRLRTKLRALGVTHGIPVVYSFEVPGEIKLLPLPDEEYEKGKTSELSPFDDFRVRILPVLGPLPSIFGLHAATYILMDLGGKPLTETMAVKNRWKVYERLERNLASREARMSGDAEAIAQQKRAPLSTEDVSYIFEELSLGRSTLPPHRVLTRPALVRWYKDQPVTTWNTAVLSAEEADRHVKEVLLGEKEPVDLWGEEAERVFSKRSRDAKAVYEWRMHQ